MGTLVVAQEDPKPSPKPKQDPAIKFAGVSLSAAAALIAVLIGDSIRITFFGAPASKLQQRFLLDGECSRWHGQLEHREGTRPPLN
eukprot:CAMPEP_0171106398 /NCGR_PEP_ID=MMETSP0766_2-20121228/64660_1 /TAXON_ID=439317 /ORGANISM="Gambierdiscus australes, Strain CAWD 149" /LENGTH=85 /DNA_ID=CAMNT_0011567483 /DNA_START=64 /DNA_END=319 /DNA_ORIENTATION=+